MKIKEYDYEKSIQIDTRIQKILEGFGYERNNWSYYTSVYTSDYNEIHLETEEDKTTVILEKYGEYNEEDEEFKLLQQDVFEFTTIQNLVDNIVKGGYVIE